MIIPDIVAHPHIAIDYQVELKTEQTVPTGFFVTWTFDILFSQEIIFEVDRNRDGILQTNEIEMVYEFAFDNTKNFNYFTRFQVGSGPILKAQRVRDFHAEIKSRQIQYRFYVDFKDHGVQWQPGSGPIGIWIYDDTFFSAFIPNNPAYVILESQPNVTARSFKDNNREIVYDPTDLGLSFSRTFPDKVEFTIQNS